MLHSILLSVDSFVFVSLNQNDFDLSSLLLCGRQSSSKENNRNEVEETRRLTVVEEQD